MKFTVGDTVRIVSNKMGHGFSAGDECIIVRKDLGVPIALAEKIGTKIQYVIGESEAELVSEVVRTNGGKIENGFINRIMTDCGADKDKAHEMYKLWWMVEHGHTLTELMQELKEVQYFDPDDTCQISTPVDELFLQWEEEYGFGGELWPCLGEFLENEYQEAQQ